MFVLGHEDGELCIICKLLNPNNGVILRICATYMILFTVYLYVCVLSSLELRGVGRKYHPCHIWIYRYILSLMDHVWARIKIAFFNIKRKMMRGYILF